MQIHLEASSSRSFFQLQVVYPVRFTDELVNVNDAWLTVCSGHEETVSL